MKRSDSTLGFVVQPKRWIGEQALVEPKADI